MRRMYSPITAPAIDFDAVRERLGVPSAYPAAAVAEAERAAANPPRPDTDLTDIEFVTIDPPGSMDLDQAMCLQRWDDGYRVRYAIADVASFVTPGGALETATWARGQTYYSPDQSTPLHPRVLSEGGASLLPDVDRPAVLWTIDLDAAGEPIEVSVARALIRSRARFDYASVQAHADAGTLHSSIELLPEIGKLRQQAAERRHAITLNMPDAEIVPDGQHWTLKLRARPPVEDYNAELSLLAGMAAARIMLNGGVGLLRTLPPAGDSQVQQLRRSAAGLGIPWPEGAPPGDVIAGVDAADPKGAAFLEDAVKLLRGAGYTPFVGAAPEQSLHAGVGAAYAHVTAPLRRLADRYATEICLAIQAKTTVPVWVSGRLDEIPAAMATSDKRVNELERACAWAVTEFLLHDRRDDELAATVVQTETGKDFAIVLLHDPPVRARAPRRELREGEEITVTLAEIKGDGREIWVAPVGAGRP